MSVLVNGVKVALNNGPIIGPNILFLGDDTNNECDCGLTAAMRDYDNMNCYCYKCAFDLYGFIIPVSDEIRQKYLAMKDKFKERNDEKTSWRDYFLYECPEQSICHKCLRNETECAANAESEINPITQWVGIAEPLCDDCYYEHYASDDEDDE